MIVKVLGGGCTNCQRTKEIAQQAVADLGLDAQIEAVTDMAAIARYGVMSTPAIVINEKVVSTGGVPSHNQMVDFLRQAQG
jgi:small redox-active disulfide protein 2